MKIHSDILTRDDVTLAAHAAGVGFYRFAERGSHSRARGFDVILEGSGRTGTRYGQNNDMIAATWDEWGIFLGALFRRDPQAHATYYHDGEHFRWSTGGRFDDLTVGAQHIRHRWDNHGDSVTGAYAVRECRCGAVSRWLTRATWDELTALV